MKIGSLCTGYGGLDMAVEAVFNAETVWVSEIDKYASMLIEQKIKKPNLGDLKVINWAEVEPIDILTAGYPCQPFSHAGYRKGTDDERHIFPYILEAISTLRPKYAIMENVRGHLSLGFKEVLQGLASIGYDASWRVVRASDVGAPHQRARLFIIAYPSGERLQGSWNKTDDSSNGLIANSNSDACQESRRAIRGLSEESSGLLGWQDKGEAREKRWSSPEITKREIPPTLDQEDRLSPAFVEYMMGIPEGWVTESGLSRMQQLKMLGNGVVPQQAEYAIRQILDTLSDQDLCI